MKASAGFAFFLLFLGGLALVNLRNMGEEAADSIPTIEILSQSAWRPSHIGEMRMDATNSLSLQFELDGKINGSAGCNRYFGSYKLDAGTLVIESVGMTRMACPEPAMSIEISFIEALQSAASVAHRDDRIAIMNKDGAATARFDAIPRTE